MGFFTGKPSEDFLVDHHARCQTATAEACDGLHLAAVAVNTVAVSEDVCDGFGYFLGPRDVAGGSVADAYHISRDGFEMESVEESGHPEDAAWGGLRGIRYLCH